MDDGLVVDRAGHRFLEPQLIAALSTLEFVLGDQRLRGQIVVEEPGVDLDAAAAVAIGHLEAARAVLAPFFWQSFAVGDVVDVVDVSETTGRERVEYASRRGAPQTSALYLEVYLTLECCQCPWEQPDIAWAPRPPPRAFQTDGVYHHWSMFSLNLHWMTAAPSFSSPPPTAI